jgi:hypothetical protein
MKFLRTSLWILLAVLGSVSFLSAQTSQGRIVGRVTDASGAIVPKANVTIQNTETGVKRILATNSAGEYFAPNLSAGLYSVSIAAPTFKTVERKGIRLEVATDVRIDVTLQPGPVSETLVVSGEQPLVETVNDTLGGTITNKSINELPLQGRDFQNLLELRPGIQRTPGGGFHSVTTNGLRFEDNNYIVDGTDNNDVYYGETVVNAAGVQGTPASHLPLDAIQEFNTQENQPAEFGFKPGAVVNVGLKSGTSQFHGTAYYFHRNSALDARNWFNPAPQTVSSLLLHQFGGSAGGPILKDKWFIFGNYEGVRHRVGNPFNGSSPVTTSLVTPSAPDGNPDISIPDALAWGSSPNNPSPYTIDPLSFQLLSLFLPNQGFTANAGDPSLINFNFNNQNREDNFVVKSDYHLGEKHVITGRYFYANSLQTEEDTSPLRPDWLSIATTKISVAGANWTWTPNSSWVNEARFGYSRFFQTLDPVDHNRSPQSYGINTGVTDPRLFGFPRISISPFDYAGGNFSWPLATTPTQTFQVLDNLSYIHGSHNLRFGGEFRRGSTDYFRSRYGRGRVDFRDLESFVSGSVRRGRILLGDTTRNITLTSFGGFVQDDWRVLPRLTVNLGLRYDLTLPIKDSADRISNFLPNQGLVQVGRGISSPYDTQYTNFSPRLGLAWDPSGTGKTVFRAGGSIIYEQPSIRNFVDRGGLNENPSGALLVGADGIPVRGNGNVRVTTQILGGSSIDWSTAGPWFNTNPDFTCDVNDTQCDVFGVKQNLATPYVASWNVNVQRELTKTTVLEMAYVATRGIKLYSHRDINQVIPALDDGGELIGRPYVQNCAPPLGINLTGGPCLPWVGFANYIENQGHSSYNGLQVTLTQKSFHGLNFLAGYTWAHAIDNGTSNRGGYPQDSNNFNAERGNGDYDIRHRFTMSLTYELPNWKAPLQLGSGWTATTIVNLQTGEPVTFTDFNNDISLTGELLDRWNFAGNPDDVRFSPRQGIAYFPDGTTNPACVAQAKTQGEIDNLSVYGCYQQGTGVFTPPADGTFGNEHRNIFRGPGFANWDMSVTKRFKLTERMNLQLRGEFFNILNHPNFDGLYTENNDLSILGSGLGLLTSTPDVAAANPVIGSGGSRHIQLGVKLIW